MKSVELYFPYLFIPLVALFPKLVLSEGQTCKLIYSSNRGKESSRKNIEMIL